MATFDEFLGSLEVDFGETNKGKKFEIFCKWFLENDPEWSKTVETVWLWDDYPHKWQRQDLGTDLVVRDNEGQIWAVQAKCFSEHRTTTKGDMNSFLADTGRKEVHRRLWLQTTNKMEAKAEKTLKGQDKPVTVYMLNDFRNAQIDYPKSFSELYKAKVKQKPRPDPHQLEAIANVKSGLQNQDRGQMIMACGTGKTFTTLWIKEALAAHTTLVLLPSLNLLSQTMREWAWAGNTDFDILNVCSDQSVGRKTEDMDPADAPFPVTSDVQEIAAFLQKESSKVIFCTYQSSDLIAQAQRDEFVPTIDLAIADEAHRCAGKADDGFATILDGSKIRAKKRLFTTATPRYFGSVIKDAAKDRNLEVIGMDNEVVFGPVIHMLTFGQAIANDLLNDYQVVIVGVDEPMVKKWIDNYEIVATGPDKETDARTLAAKIGLIKAIKDYDLKRVISFHSRVKGAKDFALGFIDVVDHIEPDNRPDGLFLTDYVSGEMNAGDRKERIDKLKALDGYERGILTNARCLAEGVDVPSLDGVAFIDPKGSQIEIIQAVGRAIRKVRGAAVQKKGTIVLPVFIADGDDPETAIEASNFKPVWEVLKALRAHDQVLADTLDKYRSNMAKNAFQARESISDRIVFDLPMSIDADFSSSLRTVLVEASTETWEFWFGLLQVFKEREGHCDVVQSYKADDGSNLGIWVSNQRAAEDRMPPNLKQKLDNIGFTWDTFKEKWEAGFAKLLHYKETNGHCRVPTNFNSDIFLGKWVSHQRNKRDIMPLEYNARLTAIGFDWDVLDTKWQDFYDELLNFRNEFGHSNVPDHAGSVNTQLGRWCSSQRNNYRKGIISDTARKKLELIPDWQWSRMDGYWSRGYENLQTFIEKYGHSYVPNKYISEHDNFKLGSWVSDRRRSCTEEQRKILEDTAGWVWNAVEERFEKGFAEFSAYVANQGDGRVPLNYVTSSGFKLGSWVAEKRKRKRMNKLPEDQVAMLSLAEKWVWDPMELLFEKGIEKLLIFKQREGHCRVPASHREGDFNLGNWVSNIRSKGIKKIGSEKIKMLNELGFIWRVGRGLEH